ncbi:MAG: choice-of-anchor tandem repeat GloVer-containing protein [Chthoniobacterales bacterium]
MLLTKLRIAAHILGKEVYREKLKWFDLRQADYRTGKKAYDGGLVSGQTQLVSELDRLCARLAELRQRKTLPATSFADKARSWGKALIDATQIGAFQISHRRAINRLGANIRQGGSTTSLEEEQQAARKVAEQIRTVETDIKALASRTYPWARRPLLLASLLVLLPALGLAWLSAQNYQAPSKADYFSDKHLNGVEAQSREFSERMKKMGTEMHAKEDEATRQRIAAAQRTYKEQTDRQGVEQERLLREREEADRVRKAKETELRKAADEKRIEDERVAAEKESGERAKRDHEAQLEREREDAEIARSEAEKKNREAEQAKVERERVEREARSREQLAEEKKKEDDRVAAEAEDKKRAEEEKAKRELTAFRERVKEMLLTKARLKVVCSMPRRMGQEGNLCRGRNGSLYGFAADAFTNRQVFKIDSDGTVTTVFAWQSGGLADRGDPDRSAGLVVDDDGNLYGTTSYGPNNGGIYRVQPTGIYTVIHRFSGREGKDPQGGLCRGRDGNFYGVTRSGGTADGGTLFRITPAGTFTTLHNFTPGTDDGHTPEGGLLQAQNGSFYGTTSTGGTHGKRITMTTKSGTRYGSEESEGTINDGTVYRITTTGELSIVHRFNQRAWGSYNSEEGGRPAGRLAQDTEGNLYGATSTGGKNGHGTLFKMTEQGALKVLFAFDEFGPVIGGLIMSTDHNLYGITTGTAILKVEGGGRITSTALWNGGRSGWFPFEDPLLPVSALVPGADGRLYGLTARGGEEGGGVFFQFDPSDNFAPSEQERHKANEIAARITPPERRRSAKDIVTEFAGNIFKAMAEAEAANQADSQRMVAGSGGYKMLCPKCHGSKKIWQNTYNSSWNPYEHGSYEHSLYESGRSSTDMTNCDMCGGTGVVAAR